MDQSSQVLCASGMLTTVQSGPLTPTEPTVGPTDGTNDRPVEPTGIFDAHVHIIDPRFPLTPNNGFMPEPFTIADYSARMNGFGVWGGTVVSGSFQGDDQSYLIAALTELGSGWVGVTQLPRNATDSDIVALDHAGVRGIRFNLRRAAIDIVSMTQQAIRAHDLVGRHTEMYVDATTIASLEPVVAKLPALSIDHLGLTEEGLHKLLDLVDRGTHVKAGGSDLPASRADRAFRPSDIDLIAEAVGDDLPAVLVDNARSFYRMERPCVDNICYLRYQG